MTPADNAGPSKSEFSDSDQSHHLMVAETPTILAKQ